MLRRGAVVGALIAAFCILSPAVADAHAGLRSSDPTAGAALGASPTALQLSFSEDAAATLSTIRVFDARGTGYETGRPEAVPDPRALVVRLRPLPRGIYTVDWRIVSAVDGHATAGTYAFGVGVAPSAGAVAARTTSLAPSWLEIAGRWLFITGLVVLLGAAIAGAARFGDESGGRLGVAGLLLGVGGLLILAEAQHRNAGASYSVLVDTSVGRALVWRGVTIAIASVALLLARRGPASVRRGAVAMAALATVVAMAVHVDAGHAGGAGWSARVVSQWAHFAAVGVWLGGLAALLLHVRGVPSTDSAAAVRRFSSVAAVGLGVVATTGVIRAVGELRSWHEVTATGYGRAVIAKVVLLALIAAFAARNRWRSLPVLESTLEPLRRTSRRELALAGTALAVAAILGAVAPPAAARVGPPAISVVGSDLATTVRVRLTVASAQPGPNRFVVRAVDYDSRRAVTPARVTLRFVALDDPDVAPTVLALMRRGRGRYAGEGANLTVDGRWRVDVLVEQARDSVTVPLAIETRVVPQLVSVARLTGQVPIYTVQAGDGFIQVKPDRERPGKSTLSVACLTGLFQDDEPVDRLVVTATDPLGRVSQQPVQRVGDGRFNADVVLRHGRNPITVVARTAAGSRRRAVIELLVP